MSEIKEILLSGLSMRDETTRSFSKHDVRLASRQLGFQFPQSYLEFLDLGGLAELRISHQVLDPVEIANMSYFGDCDRFIPFAENGCGDYYCWERVDVDEPRVFFADHESYNFTEDSESFTHWMRKSKI